ncbi:MAG: ABC transporter substrate-binding protein [Anaerolineae bacterium]
MNNRFVYLIVLLALMAALLPGAAMAAPPPQEEGQSYVIQKDDWLSKLADKYLGDVEAWPAILLATNKKAETDPNYHRIDYADVVEVGWTIWIPGTEEAEALLAEYRGEVLPAEAVEADPSQTLIVAVPGDLEGWDPATSTYFTSNEMIQTLYDRLVEYEIKEGPDGNLYPEQAGGTVDNRYADTTRFKGMLAETYGVSDDGLTWTFNLRQGVKFSSGNELTAADVEYTFDRALNMGAGILNTMLGFAGIKDPAQTVVVDPYTFQIQLEEPNNLLLHILSLGSNAGILDSQVVESHVTADDPFAEKWLRNHVAGSGPYMMEKYEPGNQVVYVANENYWKGAPKLKKVIYKTVPSAQTRLTLLLNGAIDIAYDIPGQDLTSTLKGADGVKVLSFPAPSTTVFFTNNTIPPFDDVRVRKALCYAVPYQALIDKVLYGLGKPAIGPVAYGVAYQKAVNECTYDPEKVKALLAEAGLDGGFNMTLTYREGRPEEETTAVFLQAELARYNINVELEKIQTAAWAERRSAKTITAGLDGYTPYAPDPTYVMNFWYVTDAVLNTWVYSNPRVDELTAMSVVERDPAKIEAYMTEAQTIIGQEQPVAWLFNPNWNLAMRNNIQGYVFYPDRATRHNVLSK